MLIKRGTKGPSLANLKTEVSMSNLLPLLQGSET